MASGQIADGQVIWMDILTYVVQTSSMCKLKRYYCGLDYCY